MLRGISIYRYDALQKLLNVGLSYYTLAKIWQSSSYYPKPNPQPMEITFQRFVDANYSAKGGLSAALRILGTTEKVFSPSFARLET